MLLPIVVVVVVVVVVIVLFGELFELILEMPLPPTHRTKLLYLLGVQPPQYTVHMKHVCATTPHQGAIVPRYATIRTTSVKLHTTDSTRFIVCHPMPCSHRYPAFDLHLHASCRCCCCC